MANGRPQSGPRCIAIVGPFQSGKTTLLESILERTGAIERAGRVSNGNTVGDSQPEARAHAMSVEPNVATATFLGETMTFVDCPGSMEFLHDMRSVTPVCDAAIVVCEADERKIPALEIVMRELEEADIPRFLFINKIDVATRRVRETLASLQRASRTPLLLRQIPIWKDGIAVGFIDLALERAFIYREHAPSGWISRGALAGVYAGATAEATVGAGLGANILVGGSDRSVALQPLSVQGQAGLNLAVGVADLELRPAQRVR